MHTKKENTQKIIRMRKIKLFEILFFFYSFKGVKRLNRV